MHTIQINFIIIIIIIIIIVTKTRITNKVYYENANKKKAVQA